MGNCSSTLGGGPRSFAGISLATSSSATLAATAATSPPHTSTWPGPCGGTSARSGESERLEDDEDDLLHLPAAPTTGLAALPRPRPRPRPMTGADPDDPSVVTPLGELLLLLLRLLPLLRLESLSAPCCALSPSATSSVGLRPRPRPRPAILNFYAPSRKFRAVERW